MPPTELNASAYEVLELTWRMGRASTLRFRRLADLGDTSALSPRTEVRYTVAGTCLFYGRIIPAGRSIGHTDESLEYTASDYTEWLARNPCAEVSAWYNKTTDDGTVFAYPTGRTLRQIIEAEFASIVGAGKPISALDWTDVPADVQNLIVYDFETTGKTFLGLLEALANEMPVLSWWLDPTAASFGSPAVGPVLRFYDLSAVPASPKAARLRPTSGTDPAANVVSVKLDEDISASYDTLRIYGLGDLREYLEDGVPEWSSWSGQFGQVMRVTTAGTVEVFQSGPGGGSWVADTPSLPNRPWHPDSTRAGARFVCRRYSVAHDIVDLRLQRDDSTSPPTWVRVEPSITVETLAYQWKTGPIGFNVAGVFYAGRLLNGVKVVPYTNGIVDDLGTVVPSELLYPNYPLDPLAPRVPLGAPASFDKNFLLLNEAQVRQTAYNFTANISGNPNYDNIDGSNCFIYHNIGGQVWVRYTGKSDLSVTRTNGALGYDKELRLYDQRFLKYTTADGDVIRDDTAVLGKYADALFALASRRRVRGSIELITPAAGVATAWPMGCSVRLHNYAGGTYDVPARVQEISLTNVATRNEVSVSFDSPQTFAALDKTREFRQFFRDNEVNAAQNTLKGTRGQTLGPGGGGGGGSGRGQPDGGGGRGNAPAAGAYIPDNVTTPDPENEPANPAKPRQGFVTAIQLQTGGTDPGPASKIKYQIKAPYSGATNEQVFNQVVPANPRRADADGAIIASPIGTPVVIVWDASTPKFLVPEIDYVGPDCP